MTVALDRVASAAAMGLLCHPVPDRTGAPCKHVLLEHWVTFCGYQLALCVTAADASKPDTVAVHVRYGGGQAEVTVSADEDARSPEGPGNSSSPSGNSGSLVSASPDSLTMEHQQRTSLSSPAQEQDSKQEAVVTSDPSIDRAETMSIRAAEVQESAESTVNEVVAKVVKCDATALSTPSKKRQDTGSPATVRESVSQVIKHSEKSSTAEGQRDIAPLAESANGDQRIRTQQISRDTGAQQPRYGRSPGTPKPHNLCPPGQKPAQSPFLASGRFQAQSSRTFCHS